MRFDVLTLFPEMFAPVKESILGRALDNNLIELNLINFRGFWFFQIKKDSNGKYKLLEIATRLAGAFALNKSLDVNLPLAALKDFDGEVESYEVGLPTDEGIALPCGCLI